ncbi:MAG: hypothetical protein E7649_00330 [Ruminococcaceae bacterium]|nr:hypothetical protein [Oscillospiraceae bacterium]
MMDRNIKKGFLKIDSDFVHLCDEEFERALSRGVSELCDGKDVRVVGLTGPTCSGKTTAAKKLISHLGDSQKIVHVISLDDFYKDNFSKEDLKDTDLTKADFDSPDTLDCELFYEFVHDLFEKGRAKKPIFDFKTGERSVWEEFSADDDDVFLFEGIQVLYPKVLSVIEKAGGKILAVRPMSAIDVDGNVFEPDYIRLCRRLVRDSNFRGAEPEFTFPLWNGVRANEEKNIFPYFDRCDVRIDTTMAYEMNVLAPYLRNLLGGISQSYAYYGQSREILQRIDKIEGIAPNVISKGSLYKEFV